MRFRIPARYAVAALAGVAIAGCAGPGRLYVNPEADLAHYGRVAVIPLQNLAGDRHAGDRVTRALITELMIADAFRIVEPIEVLDRLAAAKASPEPNGHVDPQKLREALSGLDVTGYLRGAVTEFDMRRTGGEDLPVVSFDVELIDLETQTVVWRVSVARRGRGHMPLVGVGGVRTLSAATQEACAEVVRRLKAAGY